MIIPSKQTGMRRNVSLYAPMMRKKWVTLPQNLLRASTLIEGFETLGDWTALGTAEQNLTQFRQGSQSIKVTSPVGSAGSITKTINQNYSSLNSCMRFAAFLHGTPTSKTVIIRLASVATFTKNFNYIFTLTRPNAWHEISIFPADWTNTGGESWDNTMIRLRFNLPNNTAGEQEIVSFDNLRGSVVQRPAVLFSWSDAHESLYDYAYPHAAQHNYRISCFVPTSLVGDAGNVTWAELAEMAAAGHVVGHHSQSHVDISTLADQGAMQAEIAAAAADLTGNGLTGHTGYLNNPGGGYNATLRAAMEAEGVDLAMCGEYHNSTRTTLPTGDLLSMRQFTLSDADTLQDAKDDIDAAVTNMEIVNFVINGLVDGPAAGDLWSLSDYEDLVEYAIKTAKTPILTAADLLNLESGPVTILKAK